MEVIYLNSFHMALPITFPVARHHSMEAEPLIPPSGNASGTSR
jgi:hypothetical protein